jgi:alkylation response protein AidB-like acyl-CoA dehydrogenase
MDFRFNEEQVLIRDSARAFLSAECPRKRLDAIEADPRGHSDALWRGMAGLGWMGICVPEAQGGSGYGLRELSILAEEIGRATAPGPFLSTMVAALAIAHYGSVAQQAQLLPHVVRGELILTLGGRSRMAPWDPLQTEMRAVVEGADLIVSGSCHFVAHAQLADRILLPVRIDAGDGSVDALILLDARSPAVRREALDVVGAQRQARVRVDTCRVGPADVLNSADDASAAWSRIDHWATVLCCAEMAGGAQRVLEITKQYACERKAFGRAIGSFQAIAHHCANMAVDVLSAQLMTDEAIWRVEKEEEEASESVAAAKAWSGDAYRRVCALGHQVHGAIGFTWEHDMHRYFRHAFATNLSHGDALHHLNHIAARLGL